MRFFILLFLCFVVIELKSQPAIYFINKTGRDVWVEKRSAINIGSYPYILKTSSEVQNIPIHFNEPAIIRVGSIPEKGVWGTADGIPYFFYPNDTVIVRKGEKNLVQLSHKTSFSKTSNFKIAYSITGNIGTPDIGDALRYLQKKNPSVKTIRIELTSPSDRDSLISGYINLLRRSYVSELNDQVAQKFYDHYFKSLLVYYKIYNPTGEDLPDGYKEFYKDSLQKWSAMFNCDSCSNLWPYYEATFRTAKLLYSENEFIDKVHESFKGRAADYILSKWMLNRIETTQDDLSGLMKAYDSLVSTATYKSIVQNNYSMKLNDADKQSDSIWLMSLDKRKVSFQSLLRDNKDKVLYIDFWASWCKPCIEEMPYSHSLRHKFNDTSIVFVYISTDEEFDSWQNAADRFKVNNQTSYVLMDSRNNPLVKEWEINTIPRYVVIDKNGRVADKDAGRPSDKKTYYYLSRLVK